MSIPTNPSRGDQPAWIDRNGSVLERGGPTPKGAFRVDLGSTRCWWSPGMWTLHGYSTDTGDRPALDGQLLLRHVHPTDFRAVDAAWRRLTECAGLATAEYHLVGADRIVRPVCIIAVRDTRAGERWVSGTLQLIAEPIDRSSDGAGRTCPVERAVGGPGAAGAIPGIPRQRVPDEGGPLCW